MWDRFGCGKKNAHFIGGITWPKLVHIDPVSLFCPSLILFPVAAGKENMFSPKRYDQKQELPSCRRLQFYDVFFNNAEHIC